MPDCGLTERQGKPRCKRCVSWDATDAAALLPAAYMLAKLAMVMPLLQEARDALTALTEVQRRVHGISPTLAGRMDIAGTYSIEDWREPSNV